MAAHLSHLAVVDLRSERAMLRSFVELSVGLAALATNSNFADPNTCRNKNGSLSCYKDIL